MHEDDIHSAICFRKAAPRHLWRSDLTLKQITKKEQNEKTRPKQNHAYVHFRFLPLVELAALR